MNIDDLRRRIPATARMNYLNTGWAGPSPTPVLETIRRRLEDESSGGPASPEIFEGRKETDRKAKEAAASLINVSPDEVLLTDSTTAGINVVVSGLPWEKGDELVTCDLEHPSILIPSYDLQRRHGVRVKVLRFAPDESHEAILSAIEGALSARTRLVFLSHIEYSSGLRMPVEAIGALVRARGIRLLLDGAQAVGQTEVDVGDIGCDFYAFPGQKWLLGPGGTGALYVRREMIPELEPVRVGFYSFKEFDQAGGFEPETDLIERFAVGSASAPLRQGFIESIRFVRDVGIPKIAERSLKLASVLKAGIADVPRVRVLSPMEGPGGSALVSFALDGADHETAVARLWAENKIVVRHIRYPDAIRTSLAFFNTEDEVAQLIEAVRRLAANA